MDRYIRRCVECLVERDLGIFGAVLIQGPKWCGKTTTAQRFAESSLSLSDPSGGFAALQLARLDPAQAIVGPMSGEGSQDSSFSPDLRRREPRTSRCTAVWVESPVCGWIP